MASVHASAILGGEVQLAEDVTVGPGCVLDGRLGPVVVSAGCTLIGHVYLQGPIRLGRDNRLYPFVCLGFAPQALRFATDRAGQGVAIGDRNVLREGATVNRAMNDDGPTTIGSDTFFMANSHAGHDCRVGDHAVLANGTLLGGHVEVGQRATIGGNTVVHQFCQVGRGAMLSGGMATSLDVPPFFTLTGTNYVGSVNLVGMRRLGMQPDEIDDVRWVYKTFCRSGLPAGRAIERLRERMQRPLIAEYVHFFERSRRGSCRGRPDPRRSATPSLR